MQRRLIDDGDVPHEVVAEPQRQCNCRVGHETPGASTGRDHSHRL